MARFLKYLTAILFFLIPFHALLITYLGCKLGLDVSITRFWKEIILMILLIYTVFSQLKSNNYSFKKIYENNNLLGVTTAFIILSLIYVYFPFFEFKQSGFLGFKYDVFFLFALIIGLYLNVFKDNFNFFLKVIFVSIGLNLIIFLPWYLFGDISSFSTFFGYSDKVSTYNAGQCIAFAQNVPSLPGREGIHRFQGTFSGPITLSVFLTIFYIIYLGYILNKFKSLSKRLSFIIIPGIFILTSIFVSYSKTSILGILFGSVLFIYLARKIILKKSISRNFIIGTGSSLFFLLLVVIYIKRDLFLHLGAVINRFDNLAKSFQMFTYNPFGYGLGIAGPASQIGRSLESAGNWQIGLSTATTTHRFLPENWYVQILLEQGIMGLALFVSILIIIGIKLYQIAKTKKDYLSISIFVAFVTICFMANFTHVFEESATSYLLFMIIGGYITLGKQKISIFSKISKFIRG